MKITIKRDKFFAKNKISINLIIFFSLYFLARLLFSIISMLMNTVPFICYDDYFIYDKIQQLTKERILNLFAFRNCYYLICMYLNKIRFFDVITGPRILNVILFYFVCLKIRSIAELLSYDKKTQKIIMCLFALSPYFIIYSMIPLREVICAWGVVYILWDFLRYEKGMKINKLLLIFFFIILYFTRVYILEVLLFVIASFKCRKSKWYIKYIIVILILLSALYFIKYSDTYLYVLNDKVEHYINNNIKSTGHLSKLSINKVSDLYKLFLLIPYVQMLPLPGAVEPYYTFNSWSGWITLFSGISAFNIPYFWIHIYRIFKYRDKDKNKELETVIAIFYIIFLILIALTNPGNARFFFFINPVFYLFGINEFVRMKSMNNRNLLYGLFAVSIPYIYLVIK